MPGRWKGSVREEPEGRGGGVVADHRADVGLAVAGVLGAVRGVDVGPGGRDDQLICGTDAVQLVAGPSAHHASRAVGRSSRAEAAAASVTTAVITRLVRTPGRKPPAPANSAPNTATASAPPSCRLVLNTPLAVPARWAGTAASSTAVVGGITSGPDRPTGISSTASAQTGVRAGTAARATQPATAQSWPATIGPRGPTRSAIRAENGVRQALKTIIGRNAAPAASEDSPRTCWKYRENRNGAP